MKLSSCAAGIFTCVSKWVEGMVSRKMMVFGSSSDSWNSSFSTSSVASCAMRSVMAVLIPRLRGSASSNRARSLTPPLSGQEVAALVTKTYEAITPHWQAVIPALTIVIAGKPFNEIHELQGFCEIQNKQPGWRKFDWKGVRVVCPEFEKDKAVLWVHYNRQSIMHPPDYYFQKELFAVIAKLIWCVSEQLRAEVKRQATGMAAESDGAAYLAFRDTFSRFFLNPEYLMERKEAAWNFMMRIDRTLSGASVSA